MAKNPRDRRTLKGFVEFLKKKAPKFGRLDKLDQLELAQMIATDSMKWRAHDAVKGATSYTYKELDARFGRGRFTTEVNAIAGVFEVGAKSWREGVIGSTRSYIMQPLYREAMRRYFMMAARKKYMDTFIDMNGKRIKTVPAAIGSKRGDGSTAKLWGSVDIVKTVPVNVQQLHLLLEHTCKQIQRIREDSLNLFSAAGEMDTDKLDVRAEWAAKLIVLANTDLGGQGWIPMRYQESESGRLYAQEVNLQNCPREVRMAALNGCLDYDISNCHYALLDQMAERAGFVCKRIQHYLQNKKAVREQIAAEVGIEIEQVKTCLLALIYGAAMSPSPLATFGKTFGQEKARALINHPLFAALSKEVRQAGDKVLEAAPKRSGSLMNAAGCGVRLNQNRRQKLAHLLQGAEAVILKAAVGFAEADRRGNVILLQHDGFTTREPLNVAALIAHIEQATGYRVAFECERIQPSADLDFSKMRKQPKAA